MIKKENNKHYGIKKPVISVNWSSGVNLIVDICNESQLEYAAEN